MERSPRIPRDLGSEIPILVILSTILVLGAILRFIGLEKESLWGDEIHTAFTARSSFGFLATEALGGHAPLHFLMTKLSVMIGDESELFVRLPSAIMGILAIPAGYLLGKRVSGPWLGLLTALFVALSPAMIWYSQEARPYITSTAFVVLSTYALAEFLERPSRWHVVLFGASAFLGLYTHYYFAFFLAVAGIVAAASLLQQKRLDSVKFLALAGAFAALAILIRLSTVLAEREDLSAHATRDAWDVTLEFLRSAGMGRFSSVDLTPLILMMWAAALFGSARILIKPSGPKILVLAAAWLYVAILLIGAVIADLPIVLRHLTPVLPLWYLIAGYGALEFAELVSRRLNDSRRPFLQLGVVGVVVIVAAAWSISTWVTETDEITKDQWREVVQAVVGQAEEGDVVYLEPYLHMTHFSFYAGDDMDMLIAEQGSQPACVRDRRLWMVVKTNGTDLPVRDILSQSCDGAGGDTEFLRNIEVGLFNATADSEALLDLPSCFGLQPTVIGTAGNDTIRGHDEDDVIVGFGGDDTIIARDGDDRICGGDGDDVINASLGDDSLDGNGGDDRLNASDGDDVLIGGAGEDTLNGGPGEDELDGGTESDTLNAGPGDDIADGGVGDDTLNGGDGDDDLQSGEGDDVINAGEGDDTLRNQAGADILRGGPGEDRCFTSGLEETLQCETSSAHE